MLKSLISSPQQGLLLIWTTIFSDINMQKEDWTGFDNKTQEPVGLYKVIRQSVKCWTLFLNTFL